MWYLLIVFLKIYVGNFSNNYLKDWRSAIRMGLHIEIWNYIIYFWMQVICIWKYPILEIPDSYKDRLERGWCRQRNLEEILIRHQNYILKNNIMEWNQIYFPSVLYYFISDLDLCLSLLQNNQIIIIKCLCDLINNFGIIKFVNINKKN